MRVRKYVSFGKYWPAYLRCLYLMLKTRKKQDRTIPIDARTVIKMNRPALMTRGVIFSNRESRGGIPSSAIFDTNMQDNPSQMNRGPDKQTHRQTIMNFW